MIAPPINASLWMKPDDQALVCSSAAVKNKSAVGRGNGVFRSYVPVIKF
jgi:hypothetical protein